MDFKPNLTPKQIFEKGSFGGTYWRPIHSSVTGKDYRNQHKKFKFLKNINENKLTRTDYDKSLNKYGVKVGSSLEEWEESGWITKYDPYGWVQWYCNYYEGRRTPDDLRQIRRWQGINGRFKIRLINMIKEKGATYDDYSVSPKIRQTLLHWGIEITKEDIM